MEKSKSKCLAWLRDSSDELSYARVIGTMLLFVLQPLMLLYVIFKINLENITNVYQWLIICIPSLVSVILFLIDLFRDKESLKVKFGSVELECEDKNNDIDCK